MIYETIFIAKCLGVSYIPLATWMSMVFIYGLVTENYDPIGPWAFEVPFWVMVFITILLSIDASVYIVLTS